MATERYIHGKHDDAHHDGMYSNRKRLDAALAEADLGQQITWSMEVWNQRDVLPPEMVQWHEDLLKFHGIL